MLKLSNIYIPTDHLEVFLDHSCEFSTSSLPFWRASVLLLLVVMIYDNRRTPCKAEDDKIDMAYYINMDGVITKLFIYITYFSTILFHSILFYSIYSTCTV